MVDPQPEEASSGLDSEAAVLELWGRFRDGKLVECPNDGMGVALSVDGAASRYRFVCTHCGLSSPWFEATVTGIALHGRSQPDLGMDP